MRVPDSGFDLAVVRLCQRSLSRYLFAMFVDGPTGSWSMPSSHDAPGNRSIIAL